MTDLKQKIMAAVTLKLPPMHLQTEYHQGKEAMHDEFMPLIEKLVEDNVRMADLLKEWLDDDYDGGELLVRTGKALDAHEQMLSEVLK